MRISVNEVELEELGMDINDPNISEIAVKYIQEHYFNGADNAVVYIDYDGYDFVFELIPN